MRIGVEETIFENLPNRRLHERIDKLALVEFEAFQTCRIRQTVSIDPFHHQYLAGGEIRIHFRNKDLLGNTRIQLVEALGVGRLGDVINLPINEFPKIIDNALNINVAIQKLKDLVVNPRPPPQHIQIERDNFLAVGPLDLDGHQISIGLEASLVDLPDGCGSNGLVFLQFKDIKETLNAQFLLDRLEGQFIRKPRHVVL
mmetsp:Transcript_6524/g.15856  ORF Transcript_6524/g.15856 Transcript_6524/m.15856 type:complete len:200 (+) Transcript_6524:1263-1862(+)